MQSVSAGFTAAAAAAGRKLAEVVEISWTGTGAISGARGAAGWTNETPYLIAHTGQLRRNAPGEDLVAPGDIGTATVTLWNTAGRFSWRRADEALAAYINTPVGLSGKLIRIWEGFYVAGSPNYVCIFTGVVTDWREDSAQATVELTCKDIGYLYLQDKRSTALAVDQYPEAWIGALADLAGIGAGSRLLDPGIFSVPWCWLDNESIVEQIWEIARADNGVAWFDQTGRLRFENVLHWLNAEHLTPAWTFTEDDYTLPEPANSIEDVATEIVSEWSGRAKSTPITLYTLAAPKIAKPGETLTWEARFSHPAVEILPLRQTSKDKDYWAVSGAGTIVTDSVTIMLSNPFAQSCTVAFTNNHASLSAHLVLLQIRGRPLLGGPTEQETQVADPAPYTFKRQRSIRGNLYVQTQAQGKAYLGYLTDKHKRIRPVDVLRGCPGIPQLELGDRVAYVDTRGAGATPREGFLTGIDWTADEQGFVQNLQVMDLAGLYAYSDYFIIGVTALGNHGRCWY